MKIAALEKMFMRRRGEKDTDMKLFLGQGFQYLSGQQEDEFNYVFSQIQRVNFCHRPLQF